MSTPRSGPPPVQNHSHQQRHLHDPPQHQTQHWSVQPPPFPNKDPIPFETIFTDPFQDPLSFSLTPPAPPSQTTNNSPPQSHLSQLIPRTKLQQHALSQPPAQPSSQPQAPPPVSQSRQQLQHSLQQPQLQQPQLPQPQLPQPQLQQPQLPQSQLPQPQLQQTQLQRSHLHSKVEPQLHRQFQQNLTTQTQPQAHDQLARHIHAHPPPYPQSKSQQPHAQLHRPLPLTDVDALTPAERRKLRIELRRGRMRARRPIAPPRPPLERSPNQLPVTAARPDTRPSAALDKKAARVIRNREVALKARQAAKTRMKNLEEENCSLKTRASTLEVENSTLKSQIEMLRKNTGSSSGSGGGGGVPWDGDLGLGSVVNAMTH